MNLKGLLQELELCARARELGSARLEASTLLLRQLRSKHAAVRLRPLEDGFQVHHAALAVVRVSQRALQLSLGRDDGPLGVVLELLLEVLAETDFLLQF